MDALELDIRLPLRSFRLELALALGRETFALVGPSGAGKTTVLRAVAGLARPEQGRVALGGEVLFDSAGGIDLPPEKRRVGFVFQDYALFPHMTVAQNIGFGLEMLGKPKAEVAARVTEMLRLVRMEELRNRKTSQISGGQQQRVALARALAMEPKVLLLDEPLSALDFKLRKDMQIELKRLQNETGITFIFVTHDQEEALTMSDRVAVMSRGHILQVGSPRESYDHPAERFVANFIGETNFLQAELAGTSGDKANVRLTCGGAALAATLPQGFAPKDKVTIVVRPEHAQIVGNGTQATLSGKLEHVVYFGTDTHFHVRLQDGSEFIVRQQNSRAKPNSLAPGDQAGIMIDDNSAQVLRD
jgi:spermidine/putrescine transport system ATP-binding protein